MKYAFFVLLTLWLSIPALAKVPYDDIDRLRVQHVVTRTVANFPEQPWIKKCAPKKAESSVGQMSTALESASGKWSKIEIVKADIPALKQKINVCEQRGSCQVYDHFLNAAQADKSLTTDILAMKDILAKKFKMMNARSNQKAFQEIRQPCAVLRGLTSR